MFAQGQYYGYKADGTRIIIDNATYSKLLKEALVTKYSAEIAEKGIAPDMPNTP